MRSFLIWVIDRPGQNIFIFISIRIHFKNICISGAIVCVDENRFPGHENKTIFGIFHLF